MLQRILPSQPPTRLAADWFDGVSFLVFHLCDLWLSPHFALPFLGRQLHPRRRKRPPTGFVDTLYKMVGAQEDPAIIAWAPSGVTFRIGDWKRLQAEVLPRYLTGQSHYPCTITCSLGRHGSCVLMPCMLLGLLWQFPLCSAFT